jgi:3-oxoadipate enol-lactonase
MRVKVNDIFINYEIAGSGKTLVLIHGLGGNTQTWDTQVPMLSRHYRVLTWDVRGHGGSDKPEGDYSAELFASDLTALLRALRIDSAFVLGHSMGGVIALRFALNFPDLCSALIVSSSSAQVNPQATKYWQDLAASVLEGGIEAFPFDSTRAFSKDFVERNPEAVEEFARKNPVNDPSCYAKAALAMSDYNYNDELGRIRCPTLIIVGDQDVMTPPGGSVRMNRLIPGSKLIIFKDSGHISYVEQPEVFSKTVLNFLAEVGT